LTLHDFVQIEVGIVVEADLDEFEVTDSSELPKEDAKIVVANLQLATEDVEVAILVGTDFVPVSLVEVVVAVAD
jgi:hypothetical protein